MCQCSSSCASRVVRPPRWALRELDLLEAAVEPVTGQGRLTRVAARRRCSGWQTGEPCSPTAFSKTRKNPPLAPSPISAQASDLFTRCKAVHNEQSSRLALVQSSFDRRLHKSRSALDAPISNGEQYSLARRGLHRAARARERNGEAAAREQQKDARRRTPTLSSGERAARARNGEAHRRIRRSPPQPFSSTPDDSRRSQSLVCTIND